MDKHFFEKKVQEINKLLFNYEPKSLFYVELIVERNFKLEPLHSVDEILKWYDLIKSKNSLKITEVSLSECNDWKLSEKKITHISSKFFEIIGLKVENSHSREVGKNGWFQPILKEVGLDGGTLGLIRKKIDGIPHYLVNAKAEPGNYNQIQISPTLQATKSNLLAAHGGSVPKFFEYFENKNKTYDILFEQWLPEDGGRFFLKRNKGIIVNLNEEEELQSYDDYKWVTLSQLIFLIKNYQIVNPHIRSLISVL